MQPIIHDHDVNLTLLKVDDGIYELTGRFAFYDVKDEHIVVDGKTYTRQWRERVDVDMTGFQSDRFWDWDFTPLGVGIVRVKVPESGFFLFRYLHSSYKNSESEAVKVAEHFHRLGVFATIKSDGFSFGRINTGRLNFKEQLYKYGKVWLMLFEYGWGCQFEISVPIGEFLKMDLTKVVKYNMVNPKYLEEFIGYDYDRLSENRKVDIMIDIINKRKEQAFA